MTTDKGILVITDDTKNIDLEAPFEDIFYYEDSYIDQGLENPCQLLRKGNCVVITSPEYATGFEWPIVVYKLSEKNHSSIENHECNTVMRCTTNRYVVRGSESTSQAHFPYNEILRLTQNFTKILNF